MYSERHTRGAVIVLDVAGMGASVVALVHVKQTSWILFALAWEI
jgi:hypothetical protein